MVFDTDTAMATNTSRRKSKRTFDEVMEDVEPINKCLRTDPSTYFQQQDENCPNHDNQHHHQEQQSSLDVYCVDCEYAIEEYELQGGQSQCDRCGNHYCRSCPSGTHMASCDSCQSWLCLHCSQGFLSDENGNKLCKRCRPWWQQNADSIYACCNCGSSLHSEQQKKCQGCKASVCAGCASSSASNYNDYEGGVIWCPSCSVAASAASGAM